MVDRAELFRIADEIHGEGKVPSHRLIRERLAGSFSDIGPLYNAWCVDRRVRPRPTKDDLPKAFGEKLATVAAAIWCNGLEEGNKAARNERDTLEAERDALRSQLNEALATLDLLEKQVTFLQADRAERSARQKRRAEEFWDRVMLEIVEILGQDAFHVATIVERLSAETRREAAAFPDGIEPSRIADKMRTRIIHKKYFEETEKNVFKGRAAPGEAAPRLKAASTSEATNAPALAGHLKEPRTTTSEAVQEPEMPMAPPKAAARPSLKNLGRRPVDHADGEDEAAIDGATFSMTGQPLATRGKFA